jgi:mono/diheme cytochrome c family protein
MQGSQVEVEPVLPVALADVGGEPFAGLKRTPGMMGVGVGLVQGAGVDVDEEQGQAKPRSGSMGRAVFRRCHGRNGAGRDEVGDDKCYQGNQ